MSRPVQTPYGPRRTLLEGRWTMCVQQAWRHGMPGVEYEPATFDLDDFAEQLSDVTLRTWQEPDGSFVTGPLGGYAPDFRIPVLARIPAWLEIKPVPIPSMSHEEKRLRCFGLACAHGLLGDYSPCEFIVFVGGNMPLPISHDPAPGYGGFRYGTARQAVRWCWCEHCRRYDLSHDGIAHLCEENHGFDDLLDDDPVSYRLLDTWRERMDRQPTDDHPMVTQGFRAGQRYDVLRGWAAG